MLTDKDIQLIKETRKQIMRNRTEMITVFFEVENPERDPYTGEIIGDTEYDKEVEVRWTESSQATKPKGFQRELDDGIEIVSGDALVTFPYDTDVYKIRRIERKGVEFKVTNVDERGLGEPNRYECAVKRVK